MCSRGMRRPAMRPALQTDVSSPAALFWLSCREYRFRNKHIHRPLYTINSDGETTRFYDNQQHHSAKAAAHAHERYFDHCSS